MTHKVTRFAIASMAVALAGLFTVTNHTVAADKLRITTSPDPGSALLLLADRTGAFKRHGIDSEIIQAESGSMGLESTVAGLTHVSTTTELSGIRARSKGAKIVIAGINASSTDWFGIVSSRNITKPEDLIGKKIGMGKGSANELYYTQFVAKHNLPAEKISVVFMGPPELIPALLRGDIDAYSSNEAWLTKGLEVVPGARILVRGVQAAGTTLVNFIYCREEVVTNSDLMRRFMLALMDTDQFIKTNRAEAVALAARGYRLDPKLTGDLMARIDYTVNFDAKWFDHVKFIGKWMLDRKMIDKEPDYATFVNPEALTKVAPDRVTLKK